MEDLNYKKEVLQCRSCKGTFHQSDVKTVQTERYGLKINEKVCPHCGSRTYGVIDYPVTEEELIYKDGKFFANHNRQLKTHMDRITDQIIEKDMLEYRKRLFVREVNAERMAAV